MMTRRWDSLKGTQFQGLKPLIKDELFSVFGELVIECNQSYIGFRLPKKHLKNSTTRNACKRVAKNFFRLSKLPIYRVTVSTRRKSDYDIKTLKGKLANLLSKLDQLY